MGGEGDYGCSLECNVCALSCIPSRLSCKEQTVEVERVEILSLASLLDLVIIPHIF